jgi:hypothetical protein
MASAEEYRRRADECRRLANEAKDGFHKKNFERLEKLWAETARKTEDRRAFASTLATIENVIHGEQTGRS